MSDAKRIDSLDDIRGREKNPNKGTDRGRELTRTSLKVFGAGRSVVVDKDGELIGGHTTTNAFRDIADPKDIIVVQSDGTKLVVVQRTDLDKNDRRAQMLAHVDNLTAHVGYSPDREIVAEVADDLADTGFLDPEEYDALFAQANDDTHLSSQDEQGSAETAANPASGNLSTGELKDTSSQLGALTYRLIIDCRDQEHQAELLSEFEGKGMTCRPLIS